MPNRLQVLFFLLILPYSGGRSALAARLPSVDVLQAGASTRVITPYEYEVYDDVDGDATYEPESEPFFDTGVDRLFDYQEEGALGPDGEPGRAGVDDDGDGQIDEIDEYLASGSDDRADPAGDNHDASSNPDGTEGNGLFESVALAGYQGFMGVEIRPMLGVHDELTTRALAVTSNGTSWILIENDLIGLLFQYMNPIKRSLEAEIGVPLENIVIASTHTHAGPDTIGLWAGDIDDAYMEFLMEQVHQVAIEAWVARESVQVRSATALPKACYDPDTLVMKVEAECDEADYEEGNRDSSLGYDQYIVQTDMRDPWVRRMEIPVMQFVADDGRTVATLVNFDDHPELMLDENPQASADFPHYLREKVEAELGGTAIYISGTLGSQMGALRGTPIPLYDELGEPVVQDGIFDAEGNPVPEWASGVEERTRSLGMLVGQYAVDAILDADFAEAPSLTVTPTWIDIRIDNPLYKLLISAIKRDRNFHEWEYIIHESYCTNAGCIRTLMQRIDLGDAAFMTAPGEFPPEYVVGRDESVAPYSEIEPPYEDYYFPALPSLRMAVDSPELFFVGLANNYFGYAIPKEDTLEPYQIEHPNYYEEVYDANICFGDSVGHRLMQLAGVAEKYSDCVAYPEQ